MGLRAIMPRFKGFNPMTYIKPTHAYLLETIDGIDTICESKELANEEKQDLKAMGFNVTIHKCLWNDQDDLADKINAGRV